MLNFRLLSRDSSDAYLAEGLADAVTSRLSQVRRLDVASRTAARLGRQPRASYYVSGTMLRQAGRLVVTVELLRATTGRNAWSQRYERADTSVLDLERDIAVGVTSSILPTVTAPERQALGVGPTRNPEAYDRLLRGDFLLAQRTYAATVRAIQEYEAAVRLDPALAAAHARIALACALWVDWEWDPQGRPAPDSVLAKGVAAAARAVALDSLSSDAWLATAYLRMWSNPRTMEGVEAGFRRAIALNPRNAEAHHQLADWLSIMERDSESVAEMRNALALDPLRVISLRNLGIDIRGAEGRALVDSALRLDPQNFLSISYRGGLRLESGDTAGARADFLEAIRLAPAESRLTTIGDQVMAIRNLGDTAQAQRLLDEALGRLVPDGPLGLRMAGLTRATFFMGQAQRGMDMLGRLRPRAAVLWFLVMGRGTSADLPSVPEQIRGILAESKPPWVP